MTFTPDTPLIAGFSIADALAIETSAPPVLRAALATHDARDLAVIACDGDVTVLTRWEAAEMYRDVPELRRRLADRPPAGSVICVYIGTETFHGVHTLEEFFEGWQPPPPACFLPAVRS